MNELEQTARDIHIPDNADSSPAAGGGVHVLSHVLKLEKWVAAMEHYFGKETPKLGFGLMRLPKMASGRHRKCDKIKVRLADGR